MELIRLFVVNYVSLISSMVHKGPLKKNPYLTFSYSIILAHLSKYLLKDDEFLTMGLLAPLETASPEDTGSFRWLCPSDPHIQWVLLTPFQPQYHSRYKAYSLTGLNNTSRWNFKKLNHIYALIKWQRERDAPEKIDKGSIATFQTGHSSKEVQVASPKLLFYGSITNDAYNNKPASLVTLSYWYKYLLKARKYLHTSISQSAFELVAEVADWRKVVRRKMYCFFSYSSQVRNFSCSAWNNRTTSP